MPSSNASIAGVLKYDPRDETKFRPTLDQVIAISACCRYAKAEGLCLPLANRRPLQRSVVVY